MSLVKWNPFNEVKSLASELDNFFGDSFFPDFSKTNGWNPSVDVNETETGYNIIADLPGINKEDINIELTNENVLTISGERKNKTEEKEGNYFRKEISYGSFKRQIPFAHKIDPENIKATYNDGVLELNVPKTEKSESKKITIN